MNFDLNDDQEAIREGIARFVQEHYPLPPAYALSEENPPSHWPVLAELGWLAIAVPETLDGLGMKGEDWAVIAAELGRGLVDEPFLPTAVLGPRLLTGTPIADAALHDMMEGSSRIAIALLEPGHRYSMLAPVTQASEGLLSGTKVHVEYGADADLFILSASDASGTLMLYAVDAGAPGLRVERYRSYEGRMVADLALDAVCPRALLHRGNAARDAIIEAINIAATMQAAEAIGGMEAAIDMTTRFLWDRSQFGQPLARFQALQHRMADLFVDLEVARSHLHCALASLHMGGPQAILATSSAKVAVMRAAERVTGECIHLHGAMGMTLEHPIGHYYRRAIALEKAWGDIDYHLRRYEDATCAAKTAEEA